MKKGRTRNRVRKMTFQSQTRTNIIPIDRGTKYKDSFMNEERKMKTFRSYRRVSTTPIYLKHFLVKSYVVKKTTRFGMKIVNSDDVFEKLIQKV